VGKYDTAGFVRHRGNYDMVCTRTCYGYGVCGYGHGMGNPNPRYTHDEPYESHSGHQMRGSGDLEWGGNKCIWGYGGVLVRNMHGNIYLSMDMATESEVADTKGSTATPGDTAFGR